MPFKKKEREEGRGRQEGRKEGVHPVLFSRVGSINWWLSLGATAWFWFLPRVGSKLGLWRSALNPWHLAMSPQACVTLLIMYFGVSKYFPSFFIRRNIAEGPLERNGILKECLGKTLLGEPTGGVSLTVGADGHT